MTEGKVTAQAVGSIRTLNTANFANTISAYIKHISTFQSIVADVQRAVDTVTLDENWQGLGRTEFRNDRDQVLRNLDDIQDIMGNMRDALIKAYDNYRETDNQTATQFTGDRKVRHASASKPVNN